MPIDTLKAAKRLQEDDTFSPDQAERIAEILSDLDVASATKEDLDDVEERLGARIDTVEERLGTRIDAVEERLGSRIDQLESEMNARFEQVDKQFEQVDRRFEQVSERFDQVDEDMDSLEDRLTQRIELSEERLGQRVSALRSDMYRMLLVGLGALAAFLTVVNYLLN